MSKQIQSICKHIFINEIREKGKNFKTQTRKQSQNIGLITFKLKKKKKNQNCQENKGVLQ